MLHSTVAFHHNTRIQGVGAGGWGSRAEGVGRGGGVSDMQMLQYDNMPMTIKDSGRSKQGSVILIYVYIYI